MGTIFLVVLFEPFCENRLNRPASTFEIAMATNRDNFNIQQILIAYVVHTYYLRFTLEQSFITLSHSDWDVTFLIPKK